jgi:hypothetical protein
VKARVDVGTDQTPVALRAKLGRRRTAEDVEAPEAAD